MNFQQYSLGHCQRGDVVEVPSQEVQLMSGCWTAATYRISGGDSIGTLGAW